MSVLGERLKVARGNISQAGLAKKLGVHPNTLANYEDGSRTPDVDFLVVFSRVAGADLSELLTLKLESSDNQRVIDALEALRQDLHADRAVDAIRHHIRRISDFPPSAAELTGLERRVPPGLAEDRAPYCLAGFELIPRYDIAASAGPGLFADDEQRIDFMAFKRDFIRGVLRADPSQLVLIAARGDSMEPAIRAGDLLLVDRSFVRLDDDAIYIIVRAGAVQVKRLRRDVGTTIVIVSDNAALYPPVPVEAADIEVKGRVRWIGRLI